MSPLGNPLNTLLTRKHVTVKSVLHLSSSYIFSTPWFFINLQYCHISATCQGLFILASPRLSSVRSVQVFAVVFHVKSFFIRANGVSQVLRNVVFLELVKGLKYMINSACVYKSQNTRFPLSVFNADPHSRLAAVRWSRSVLTPYFDVYSSKAPLCEKSITIQHLGQRNEPHWHL